MELLQRLHSLQRKTIGSVDISELKERFSLRRVRLFLRRIRRIGLDPALEEYEKRKLGIFNQLNFFQVISGILIPLFGSIIAPGVPALAWLIAGLPALISLAVLWLNARYLHELALLLYFIFYPVFTCIIFMNGMNLGVELLFVLYGILAVFFFRDLGYMIFFVCLSMVSYLILAVLLQNYQYQLKSLNIFVFMLNQLAAMGYIFYGLYLIRRENTEYQLSIIEQKAELRRQAALLKKQADELAELNLLNNKLFSVISHDLKTPMYALRNFFQNAKNMKLSAREIKGMLPDVINDLNYTTGLMDNLLYWARNQLQRNEIRPQEIDISAMVHDVVQLLRLQAESKKLQIDRKADLPIKVWADYDMISLVIRNLLSNAIKFTGQGGKIVIGTQEYGSFVEVYVRDSGVGISTEAMERINENNFYSTTGTASESGTGLGLSLCKEFLARNGGKMMIESEPGAGSTFSFTLPR